MDLLDEHLWARQQLLRNVQQRFGAIISNSGHCNELANEIALVTKVRLSNSSLRRVFGLVPYPHSPTAHMLNTLAQYVGHANYKAFCHWLFHKEGIQIRITNYRDGWKVSRLLGNALRTDSEAQAILYPILAQTEGYFNNWMEIDHLCLCHYKGLQHYLAHHSGPDALCLGHGWLTLAGLLNPEVEDWQQRAEALAPLMALWQAHGISSIVHPFLAGRALGAHFVRCYAKEVSTDTLWQYVLQESRAVQQVMDKWAAHPALAHAVAEVLLVAGHTLQAKELLAAALEAHAGQVASDCPEMQLFVALPKLYFAFCLATHGEMPVAGALLQSLQPATPHWPLPKWGYSLWYRYWYYRTEHLVASNPESLTAAHTIALAQAWPTLAC